MQKTQQVGNSGGVNLKKKFLVGFNQIPRCTESYFAISTPHGQYKAKNFARIWMKFPNLHRKIKFCSHHSIQGVNLQNFVCWKINEISRSTQVICLPPNHSSWMVNEGVNGIFWKCHFARNWKTYPHMHRKVMYAKPAPHR